MQINTELSPGDWVYFLIDNKVRHLQVVSVRTESTAKDPLEVTYAVFDRERDLWVRVLQSASGATKEALLAKL